MSKTKVILGLLVTAGVFGLYFYNNKPSAPGTPGAQALYSYTSGTVMLQVQTVSPSPAGFSFIILVNGTQVYADNVQAGDQTYTQQAGTYVVNWTPNSGNTGGTIYVFQQGNSTQLASFTLKFDGTQGS